MQHHAIGREGQKQIGGTDESEQEKEEGERTPENVGGTKDIQFGGEPLSL